MIRWLLLLALAVLLAVEALLLVRYAQAQESFKLTPGTVNPVDYISTAPGAGRSPKQDANLSGANERATSAGVGSYPAQVTPALVCAVQHAIRWRDEPWSERLCESQAQSFTTSGERWGFDPLQLFAMAIIESDLRLMVIRFDRGGMDIGEMAVRCKVSQDVMRTRCMNKPVKGLTPAQVMQPWRNIEKGAEILATLHAGSLTGYNGGPNAREHGYSGKVAAIMAALGGVKVLVKGATRRKRVEQIARAVRP